MLSFSQVKTIKFLFLNEKQKSADWSPLAPTKQSRNHSKPNMLIMVLADNAAHIEAKPDSMSSGGPLYNQRSLKVWLFTRNTQTKTIWLLLYIHLAFNLKQWKKSTQYTI